MVILLAGVKVALLAGMILGPSGSSVQLAPQVAPQQFELQAESQPRSVAAALLDDSSENVSALQATSAISGEISGQASGNPAQALEAQSGLANGSLTAESSASPAPASPVQDALVHASSRSASAAQRLLGSSVAYAADMPAPPELAPPVPNVNPLGSPITPERVVRPDEITQPQAPAPTVAPYVSRDSAVQRQADLNRREQELLALQQQMESRMTELHGLENRIQGMLDDATATQDSKFRQLVEMYANMKPRVAAQALMALDETIAVKILAGMKSKESGEILSYMDPVHAARLSEVMAKMRL